MFYLSSVLANSKKLNNELIRTESRIKCFTRKMIMRKVTSVTNDIFIVSGTVTNVEEIKLCPKPEPLEWTDKDEEIRNNWDPNWEERKDYEYQIAKDLYEEFGWEARIKISIKETDSSQNEVTVEINNFDSAYDFKEFQTNDSKSKIDLYKYLRDYHKQGIYVILQCRLKADKTLKIERILSIKNTSLSNSKNHQSK